MTFCWLPDTRFYTNKVPEKPQEQGSVGSNKMSRKSKQYKVYAEDFIKQVIQ